MTVDDVARAALSSVGSNAGVLQTITWVTDRYRQLSNRGKLRALRKIEEITIPAAITDGTVTTVRGSDIVTGDATAQAAWVAATSTVNSDNAPGVNPSIVGRYIRYRRVWYKITNLETVAGQVRLRLHVPVSEDDSTGVTYKMVQRHTRMPKDMRFLGQFVQQRLWRPITQVSIRELDFMHPERLFVAGTGPEICAEIGEDDDGVRLMEFYPYPTNNENLLFTYYQRSPVFQPGDKLSDDIDLEAIKMGVLIDVYRFEMGKAAKENKVDMAGFWRNEMRAQETTWEKRMEEMMHVDRSTDDVSVILHTMGPPVSGDFTFIRTARQDSISRLGNFP